MRSDGRLIHQLDYNRAEGGGIALDMMAHWRYMIDTFEEQTDQIALASSGRPAASDARP